MAALGVHLWLRKRLLPRNDDNRLAFQTEDKAVLRRTLWSVCTAPGLVGGCTSLMTDTPCLGVEHAPKLSRVPVPRHCPDCPPRTQDARLCNAGALANQPKTGSSLSAESKRGGYRCRLLLCSLQVNRRCDFVIPGQPPYAWRRCRVLVAYNGKESASLSRRLQHLVTRRTRNLKEPNYASLPSLSVPTVAPCPQVFWEQLSNEALSLAERNS